MALLRRFSRFLKRCPIHPFLFAVYPVFALLANNANEVRLVHAARSLLIAFLLAAAVLVGLYAINRRWPAAGVLTTLFLIGFFSYGHLYDWGRHLSSDAFSVVRHRYLLPAFLALIVGLAALFWRKPELHDALTPVLNGVGLLLVTLPLITVSRAELENHRLRENQAEYFEECHLSIRAPEEARDVYYIILDAYARQDVLAETYGYNNDPFLDELEARGFYVAEGSQSNYASTGMSLASSLNLDYLPSIGAPNQDYWAAIRKNEVRNQLECLGYRVVGFDSGYDWSTWRGADIFLSPIQGGEGRMLSAGLNAFEAFVVNSTLLRIVVDAAIILPEAMVPDVDAPTRRHRRRIEFTFDFLESEVEGLASPKFVFAHVIAPHSPFIFGPQGEARDPEGLFTFEYRGDLEGRPEVEAYTDQLRYVNRRLLSVVDGILAAYPRGRSPIIIVQSDHGPTEGPDDRMRILNAYRLPDKGQEGLYDSISPVNSFRVIFNKYFGGDYKLLPDVSCYSTYRDPFDFRFVPNPLGSAPGPPDPVSICG